MKNKILFLSSVLACCVLFVVACKKTEPSDSFVRTTSQPYLVSSFLEENYIYGQGNSHLYSDLPDIIGVVVDTTVGFEGGHGGKTGMDTLNILKSDITFGDTMSAGGSALFVQKFNKSGYRSTLSANLIIAAANTNPGPTALEGNYLRASNGYIMELKKVDNGIYLLSNPGGAASVAPNPTLLYDYKSSVNKDSLSFANQPDLCGGGTQLVGQTAPLALTSQEYTDSYPPEITSLSPITLVWRVYSFGSTAPKEAQGVTCKWGPSVRTFVKQ